MHGGSREDGAQRMSDMRLADMKLIDNEKGLSRHTTSLKKGAS